MKNVQKLIVDFLEVEPRSLIRLRSKSPKRIRFYVFNRRFVLSNRYKSVRIGVCRFGEKIAPRSLVGHTSSNSFRIFGKNVIATGSIVSGPHFGRGIQYSFREI